MLTSLPFLPSPSSSLNEINFKPSKVNLAISFGFFLDSKRQIGKTTSPYP
jgi:hypothetical protein